MPPGVVTTPPPFLHACAPPTKDGEDCRESMACENKASTCYVKNNAWASCNATCSQNMLWANKFHGSWEEQHVKVWDCTALWQRETCNKSKSEKSQSTVQCSEIIPTADGQDCSTTKMCANPSSQCYRRDLTYSECNATCAENQFWVNHSWMTFDSPQGWDCAVLPTDCIAAPVTAAPVTTTQAVVAPVTAYADHADAAAAEVTSNQDANVVTSNAHTNVKEVGPVTSNQDANVVTSNVNDAPITVIEHEVNNEINDALVTKDADASPTRAWSTVLSGLNYMQVMAHPDMIESIITTVKKAYSSIAGTSPEQISVDLAPGSIVVKITGNLPVSMTQTFEASLAKATGDAVAGIAGIDQVATGAIVGLTCGQGGCGTQQPAFQASGSMPASIQAAQQAGVAAALMGASAIQLQQP